MKLSDLGFDFGGKTQKADINDDLRKIGESLGSIDGDVTDKQHTLPPIEEWVRDPYYIGDWALSHERGGLYPALRQSVIDAWKPHITEIILAGSAGSGKCLAGDTPIADPDTGRLVPLRDCAGVVRVNSYNEETSAVETHAVSEFIPSGVKPVVRLKTKTGREVVTTPQHKYLTPGGWKPVFELNKGDLIAVPRQLHVEGKKQTDPRLLELLGLIVSSTYVSKERVAWGLNNAEAKYVALSRISEFFDTQLDVGAATIHSGSEAWRSTSLDLSAFRSQLLAYGVDLSKGRCKDVPSIVFESDNAAVAGFLRGVCLGSISVNAEGHCASILFMEKALAESARHLFLRLGIFVTSKQFNDVQHGQTLVYWKCDVFGRTNITKLLKKVGVYGHRSAMLGTILAYPDMADAELDADDVVPRAFWDVLEQETGYSESDWEGISSELVKAGVATATQMQRAFDVRSTRDGLHRLVAQAVAKKFGSARLAQMASSDVYWDRVDSISPCGETDVYDLTVPGPHNFVAADIVCHNSNRACILLLRLLQELLCYKNPGKALGLSAASTLVIAFASVSKQKSREVGFDRFATMVKQSQFIMENFPPNPKFSGKLVFDDKKIACKPVVSGERGILSEDLIGLLIDEAAFMDVTEKSKKARGETQVYDSASNMYHQANARMKTRFHDTRRQMPGKVIIASSAQFPDDFVSRRRVEVEQTLDKSVYVSDLAVWQAKPPGTYSNHTFRVEIGDENRFSRILKDDDEPRPGARIIDVPIDLRREFEGDLDRAIRDLAGVPLLTLAPFITNREAVRNCVRTVERGHDVERCVHPFATGEGETAETTTLQDGCDFVWEYLCVQDKDGAWVPRSGRDKFRVIHFDPSFVNDATGFAVGHPTSVQTVIEIDPLTGEPRSKQKVGVDIDVMLRVVCPEGPGSEISWPALEQLVVRLQDHGFDIALVSSDSPAGRVFVQRFRELGFYAETASVDKTPEPYLTLKKLINEGLISYYDYDPFIQEIFRLEWNKRRNKIDHPRSSIGGVRPSKDVADAVAMVAYHIATRHDEFDTSGPAVSFGAL